MSGYDHDWSHFDQHVPYEIVFMGSVANAPGSWNSSKLQIKEKATGRVIREYDFDYPNYGTTAFYPFKWEDHWYAVFGPSYVGIAILDLETGEIYAEYEPDGSWCPVGFYVPASYCDKSKPSFTIKEKNHYIVTPDHNFNKLDTEYDEKHLYYHPVLFVTSVFWAADYEWLVFRLDLSKIMETRTFPTWEENDANDKSLIKYCFEYDYGISPSSTRNFMKRYEEYDSAVLIEYYTQRHTKDFFKTSEGNEESP